MSAVDAVEVYRKDALLRRQELPPGDVVAIGRAAGSAVVLDAEGMAPTYALLRRREGRLLVVVLSEPPAATLNGAPLKPKVEAEVRDGDAVGIGEFSLRFALARDPAGAAPGAAPPLAPGVPKAPIGRPSSGKTPAVSPARPHDKPVVAETEEEEEVPETLPEGAEPLEREEIAKYDFLAEIPAATLDGWWSKKKGSHQMWRRRYRRGEVICREGDFGSTAYYITKGAVAIGINAPMGHVKSKKGEGIRAGLLGLVRRFASAVVPASKDPREEEVVPESIPIDAPVDLPYTKPIGKLGEGDLFGEMTCLSFYPRSATCVADSDEVECLEMVRSALIFVKEKSKFFRERIEEHYRERTLDAHLRSARVFAGVSKPFISFLKKKIEFVQAGPGDVICREGDPADAFYLIRVGFVKVSQARPGGDLVLRYLGPGQHFGEVGVMSGRPRTATCTALDHLELVRVNKKSFMLMLDLFPEIHAKLDEEVQKIVKEDEARRANVPSTVALDDFLVNGLMNAQNVLLIDLDRCTRCDDCVRACAAAHDGVTRLIRDGLRFDKYLVTTSCRACTDPVCMIGCPVGSIVRRNSLEILILDHCIGCGICAKNCPYGNINMHDFTEMVEDLEKPGKKVSQVVNKGKGKATCCDLCSDLKEPSCVYACPHKAAIRVKPIEYFASDLAGTGVKPGSGRWAAAAASPPGGGR